MTPALRVFALVAVCIGCTLAITCEEICPEPAADEAVCGEGETFGSACIANCLEVTEFTAGACGGDSSTTTSTTTRKRFLKSLRFEFATFRFSSTICPSLVEYHKLATERSLCCW
eukprot:m.644468 g.644468  ORF g.644468 m.644468 type:complete len:115 (+) comp58352_c0_seq20:3044-3388(+)